MSKPYILNIGGFDSSNGAGITSDVKTIEAIGGYALSVQTCLTIQHESELTKVYWHSMEQIKEQIDILAKLYQWEYAKISLTNGLRMAKEIIDYLLSKFDCKIVWDPVMQSSSGYDFYRGVNQNFLDEILSNIYLATPNWNEIQRWDEKAKPLTTASRKARITNLYLKGGHNEQAKGVDYLFLNTGKIEKMEVEEISEQEKHGSGCVFASALTTYLAQGDNLIEASKKAKQYIFNFLESEDGLLGTHSQDLSGFLLKEAKQNEKEPDRSEVPSISKNQNQKENIPYKPSDIYNSTKLEKLKPDTFFHIYNRGVNKQSVFFEEENYEYFLDLLEKYIAPVGDIYAYCLIENHYHLLVKFKSIESDALKNAMSNFSNAYTKAINNRFDRTSSLFDKPFKRKEIVDHFNLQDCLVYINTNSVKHKLNQDASNYKWSSYKPTLRYANRFIDSDKVFELFDSRYNFLTVHEEKMENLIND